MAEVHRVIGASPERVWSVLADGWLYSNWVVGAPHVRAVAESWPQAGSYLRHASGAWPLLLKDVTVVQEADPPRLLVLKPRLWPLGRAEVTLRLEPEGEGRTRVTIGEDFEEGPMRWAMVKANDLVLHRRNAESLRRLADVSVNRKE